MVFLLHVYKSARILLVVVLTVLLGGVTTCANLGNQRHGWDHTGWQTYGGDKGGSRYSLLKQINRSNVSQLEVAWTYHTGDHRVDPPSTIECNPIVVDGVMYLTSPQLKVMALNAATGEEIWRFDPFDGGNARGVNRGVVYARRGDDGRILFTAGATLYALDASTGKPISEFGEDGTVDLRKGLGRDVTGLTVMASSPGIVYEDLLILGSTVSEGPGPAAPGHIRAYNVETGRQEWIFRTIPRPGSVGYETWPKDAWKRVGGANSWGGLTLDEARGMVFVPTGSPTYDFYGGNRHGKNLFGNSVIALDAATGERIWHFQTVHHDLWDYDLPAPPNLVTVHHGGEAVDAVAQVTKTGYVYLLDRDTGKPLFGVEERPMPPSHLEGEEAWPTQPIPVKPPPFARQAFTEEDITNISPEARAFVEDTLEDLRYGSPFIPPSIEGSVMMPFFNGGAEWSGASFDPETGLLYVNANDKPSILAMAETKTRALSLGEEVYQANCATCHGLDRTGEPPMYPSLVDIEERRSQAEVAEIISTGQGRMPAFPQLSEEDKAALVAFLRGEEQPPSQGARSRPDKAESETPYRHTGWHRFEGPDGYPAAKPPWGTLNAINLNTGEIEWKVPLGEYEELTKRGIPPTGTENYGGSIVTEGGLVFIGGSKDERFRAFDKATGKILWETTLPAGGYATPATYQVNGKQYVVIAAGGGGKNGTKASDTYVAFSLPEK